MKKLLLALLLLGTAVSCGSVSRPSSNSEPASQTPSSEKSETPSEKPSEKPSENTSSEVSSEQPSSEPSSEPTSSEAPSSEQSSTETSEEPTPESYTFYYYNNLGWEAVAVHYWVDGGAGTTWPGEAATPVEGEENWYSITFSAEEIEGLKFIFNNNNKGQQTPDMVVDPTNPYHYGKAAAGLPTKDACLEAANAAVVYDWYLKGNMNGWSDSESFGLTLSGESTTEYVITLDLAANAEFKIANAKWHGYGDVKADCKSLIAEASKADANIKVLAAGNYTIYFETAAGENYGIWITLNA